mgnify:CR=1 FL=1
MKIDKLVLFNLMNWLLPCLFLNLHLSCLNAQSSSAIFKQIKKLNFLGTVLYFAAHPDDENTRVIDLQGKMMLPGFQDAHVHPIEAGMAYLGCSLHAGLSVEDYVKLVAQCAEDSPEAPFIDGGGWTMDLFKNGLPDKRLLDAVVSDKPVILKSASGHQIWVNSKMLELAGIDSSTIDPPRGRIDRYQGSKEPSGSLQENSAMNLIFNKRPRYSEAQMTAALKFGQQYLNQYEIYFAISFLQQIQD